MYKQVQKLLSSIKQNITFYRICFHSFITQRKTIPKNKNCISDYENRSQKRKTRQAYEQERLDDILFLRRNTQYVSMCTKMPSKTFYSTAFDLPLQSLMFQGAVISLRVHFAIHKYETDQNKNLQTKRDDKISQTIILQSSRTFLACLKRATVEKYKS